MSPMSLPPARSPLQQFTEQLARGDITPRAAADQALQRANRNAGRNVYIALDAEKVREQADELPRRFPYAAKPLLYGVPLSIKDCFDVAGFPTSLGSRFYAARNGVAREDSAVAARLRSQGAILIGKSHMHTLAYGITGENPDYGDCVQPGDASKLTGGSSSGAAASVQEQSALAATPCVCPRHCADLPDTARRWGWPSRVDCGTAACTWRPPLTRWDGCSRICAMRRCWQQRCFSCLQQT
jgi:Asp-tRNA(Asn)/Glu-tRNA(Gln) amidotransferase A subunit family amidase